MATISTLAVNLIARTSAFEKGMRRSRNATKSLKATISGAVGTVAKFAKGLLVAAGVGGMGFMLKRTMAMIDATAKLSDRLGIATESLIGLRHAANIAGLSSDMLDKSLEIFVRRMGEVKSGSGEAKRGLEALGLSADAMIKMTPEKSLGVIADKIKSLGTQAEKSAAAYFLFGRSGAKLLNLFESGSAGLEAMQREAEKLGLTFNRIDAAKVEAANDAITRLKGSMQGLVNEVTIRLAPGIKRLTNFLIQHRNIIISVIKNTVMFAFKAVILVKSIKLVKAAVNGLVAVYKALTAAQVVTLSLGGPAGWATLAAGVAVATGAILGLNKAISGTIGKISEITSKQELSKEAKLIAEVTRKRHALEILQRPRRRASSAAIDIKFIERAKKSLDIARAKLKIVQDERKANEAKTKADIRNLRLFNLAQIEGEKLKAKFLKLLEPEAKIKAGRFQEIRSRFIDTAALTQAGQSKGVEKNNILTEKTNMILEEMNRRSMGVFLT